MSVRTRLLVAVICAVALVVGGASLERLGPRSLSAGQPQEPISGAWSCPHGGGEGWRVWVTVANPGPDPVEVRMTTSAGGAAPPASTSLIEPNTLRYFEVNAPLAGSATVVEYLGGTVAAGDVVMAPEGGVAAEPCADSPGSIWHVSELSTLRGETAYLVVHNPFVGQAVVDVTLTTPEDQIRPGRLQGIVLGPLDARAFELNNYVLGEKSLTAVVTAPQGRVAAASVVVSPGSVRSSLAVPASATRWILPGAGAETDLVVRALPDQDAPVSAEVHGEQGPIPALDLEVVPAGTSQAFALLADGGFLVESDGPRPMVVGRRMFLMERTTVVLPEEGPGGGDAKGQRPGAKGSDNKPDNKPDPKPGPGQKDGGKKKGDTKVEEPAQPPTADVAATSGASVTSDRWLVLPAVGPEGGPSIVLIQNPGDEEVTTSITLLGAGGLLGPAASVTVPPRSTVRFTVPDGAPAAALIEGGEVVAAQATLTPAAFAVTLGLRV